MNRKPIGKVQHGPKVPPMKLGHEGGPSGGTRRRGSILKPYLDASMLDPSALPRSSFDGVNSDLTKTIASMGIYVPVYDNRRRKQESIKERLAEATQRLNKTIAAYETLNDYEKETKKREQTLKNTRGKLQRMEDGEMKDTISSLLRQNDNNVSENTIGAINQRDDLLYELADWFSADHSELDSLQVSIDEKEENEIEKNYTNTLTNFEKLKRVQHQLKLGKLDTKKMLALQKEQKMLEMDVINSVKEMKSISIQAFPSTDGEPPPWKSIADQVVDMLNNVRSEGSQEMLKMSSHLTELLKNLDQQQKQIKSLQSENRREKKVSNLLTGEVTDLKADVIELQEKVVNLKMDLDIANKDLENALSEKANAMSLMKKSQQAHRKVKVKKVKRHSTVPEEEFKLRVTLSGLMEEFLHDEVPVHKTNSDPALLNSSLKDHREGLHLLAHEVERLQNFNAEIERDMNEQEIQIKTLQDQLEDLLESSSSESLLRSSVRLCENCKKRGEISFISMKESIRSNMGGDELNKMREKLKYFQKCLADTELKLSDAYKEISDLRMQFSFDSERRLSVPPSTPSEKKMDSEEKDSFVDTSKEEQTESKKTPEVGETPTPGVELQEDQGRQRGKGRRVRQSSKKKRVNKFPPLHKDTILGMDESMIEEELPDELVMPEAQSEREEKLWKLGDLQGRMSQLMTEILQFVKLVADMIGPDQEKDTPRLNTMQTIEFDIKGFAKGNKPDDSKTTETQQRRSEVFFHGQKAVGCLKDAYELLSGTLSLQHDDYELIYRAFKNHQFLRSIMKAVIAGKLPLSALEAARKGRFADFDMAKAAMQHGVKSKRKADGFGAEGGVWKSVSASSITSDQFEGHKSALNNAVLVLGIHRSKSEVDVHSVQSDVSQTSSQYLPREHSQILLSPQEILRERRTAGLNREETKIPTTKIPKKGLIKLTSLDHEMQDPTYYDKHKEESEDEGWMRRKPLGHISDPHKTFTKKTMLSHIKEGTRMLAEEEKIHQEQEEIEKQLGEYTFGDLHKNLEDITHSIAKKNSEEMIKSVTRKQKPTVNKPMIYGSQNKTRQQPVERSVTLPSIKDFSFG